MKPKRTILCVDDNEQSLSIRKVLLETRGYRVLAYTVDSDNGSMKSDVGSVRRTVNRVCEEGL